MSFYLYSLPISVSKYLLFSQEIPPRRRPFCMKWMRWLTMKTSRLQRFSSIFWIRRRLLLDRFWTLSGYLFKTRRRRRRRRRYGEGEKFDSSSDYSFSTSSKHTRCILNSLSLLETEFRRRREEEEASNLLFSRLFLSRSSDRWLLLLIEIMAYWPQVHLVTNSYFLFSAFLGYCRSDEKFRFWKFRNKKNLDYCSFETVWTHVQYNLRKTTEKIFFEKFPFFYEQTTFLKTKKFFLIKKSKIPKIGNTGKNFFLKVLDRIWISANF